MHIRGGIRSGWFRRGHRVVALLTVLWLLSPVSSLAQAPVSVPSGQEISLVEQFLEPQTNGEVWFRMRFLAPQIGTDDSQMTYEKSEADFLFLCQSMALPNLAESDNSAEVIIITLMDRQVAFGTSDQQATQFFEAFRPENATCIWEDL